MKNSTAKAMMAIINVDMLPPRAPAWRADAPLLMPLSATMTPSLNIMARNNPKGRSVASSSLRACGGIMSTKRNSRPKVLLAWDIEDPAAEALAAVRRLIESGAKAEAFYVSSSAFRGMPEWDRRTLKESWRAKFRKHGIQLKFLDGSVIERLLACIKQRRPDLVVLGSKRAGRIERVLFGSVAKAVRRRSTAPVLIVPARRKP